MLMDAFSVALRLPNHFRAIFAEGAFSTAFVPAFSRIREQAGHKASMLFQGQILSLMLVVQLALLVLVLLFTPAFVSLLAPGFASRPDTLQLAITLTRITFPYLALMTVVVLWTGVLNAEKRYFEGAAAGVLFNVAIISTLLAGAMFTTYAHAAAWGVLVAGLLELMLLAWGAWRAGLLAMPAFPRASEETRRFFSAFWPAVIGSAGVQIAMLADTIIVTFLPQGGASTLYYADRLYQLPVGVIGIAAGTVLLPEMSRLIAAGREDKAHRQQNHALGMTFLLAMPFAVAFLMVPEVIVAAIFGYGAFGAEAVAGTAKVLSAYGIGLIAVVSIRSIVASFHARGDTKTPLYASLTAIAINLALKLVLWREHGAAGLAAATAIGAIANALILYGLAWRSGKTEPDVELAVHLGIVVGASIWLVASLRALAALYPSVENLSPLAQLLMLGGVGALAYLIVSLAGAKLAGIRIRLR